MFTFGISIGIYAYLIFLLGITGLLYNNILNSLTIVFWGAFFYLNRRTLSRIVGDIKKIKKSKDKLFLMVFLFVFIQGLINLLGALGPEIAFDALWYHLTIPKLWLNGHKIFFIPGGLLYYSAMPKLGELLYTSGLVLFNEQLPKLIHFSFGLLTCIALYKLSRKFFSPFISLIAVVIFYSNLVVAWESITAYVDLVRTFFEVMALWSFINWWENQKLKWFILSAIMVGLAIATKLLAIGSLAIFSMLIIYKFSTNAGASLKLATKRSGADYPSSLSLRRTGKSAPAKSATLSSILVYWTISLAIPLPWFLFSYINTGNPVYPFFTQVYKIFPEPLTAWRFFSETWNLFIHSPDPLSPIYIMFLPLVIYVFPKLKKEIKIIALYSFIGILMWYFTPRTGGGRFILAFLPAFSIVCAAVINFFIENRKIYGAFMAKFLVLLIMFVTSISIVYRFAANSKYIPVILGKETKDQFLTNHLNFPFGDFYDTDRYFERKIKQTDKVLLLGFHNLYYVNFPFIDSSWIAKGERFNYIAIQGAKLPSQFGNWNLIYNNPKTHVELYSMEGGRWEYWKY